MTNEEAAQYIEGLISDMRKSLDGADIEVLGLAISALLEPGWVLASEPPRHSNWVIAALWDGECEGYNYDFAAFHDGEWIFPAWGTIYDPDVHTLQYWREHICTLKPVLPERGSEVNHAAKIS